MDYIHLLDLSRDLQSIRAKNFINRFYLIFRNSKILFQKIFVKGTKHVHVSQAVSSDMLI